VRPGLCLQIGCDTDIVVARQQGRALAASMEFSPTDSAFIATTISELARALLAHTPYGEIRVQRVDDRARSGVVIVARDPIARDQRVASPLQASDLSLPDIGRLVDELDIALEAGGTTIRATKWLRR
jgi:serine/threonine-protein kinase RsbT